MKKHKCLNELVCELPSVSHARSGLGAGVV